MEKTIIPDKKYNNAQLMILSTITGLVLVIAVIAHIIIFKNPDPEAKTVIWSVSIGAILIMWIISYPFIHLWIKNLKYIIHDDRVTIHKGILTKKHQNIPYRSITDFVLKRGPYDRILGIGSIQIQTAGQSQSASGYEGSLSGLLDYESLHTELREKIKSLHPVSESTTSEPVNKPDESILIQILEELKEIRRNTEK